MKYCNNCNQNVQPYKKFSIGWFLLGFGVFYLIYYIVAKRKECPICGNTHLEHSIENGQLEIDGMTAREARRAATLQRQETNIVDLKDKLGDSKTKSEIAKAKTQETIRKRKARKLPWQIKKDEKKQAKLNKVN